MVVLIVGNGANNIVFPVTALPNMATARDWILNNIPEKYAYLFNGDTLDLSDLSSSKREKLLVPNFFHYYYGGCGECHSISLIEIEWGEAGIFCFDLD